MTDGESIAPIPAHSIMLHIGAHKTGTTSLQAALFAARARLQDQGVLNVVDEGREDANLAARSVQRLPASGSTGAPVDFNVWKRLVRSANDHPDSRISISAESFAVSESAIISTIVEELGHERIQVVITLRPLAKILPSQWQQDLHGAWSNAAFDVWLRETLEHPQPHRKIGPLSVPHQFWFRHRHDALVARWAEAVGSDRITLVVVDEQRKVSLFETFERLLDVESGTLQSVEVTRNQSMTRVEMQIMQRYGELLESTEVGRRIVEKSRYHKALRILRKIRPDNQNDERLVVPPWSRTKLQEIQHEIVANLQSSGARVIGSLERLNWLPEGTGREAEQSGTSDGLSALDVEAIAERMLKNAARRLEVGGSSADTAVGSQRRRSVGSVFAKPRETALRALRLGLRYIRIRF